MGPSFAMRQYAKIAAIASWITIMLRFYLAIDTSLSDGTGIGSGIVSFFSYFTVLTNILVALAFTAGSIELNRPHPQLVTRLLRQPSTVTAIAVYITIVAAVYHILLSHLWDPQGLTKIVDVMLHSVMPAAYLIYWWLGVPKRSLRWRGALVWLMYPVGYSVYTLLLGAVRNKYPYPFSDVNALGYARVLLNSLSMFALFAIVSLVFISVGRLQTRPDKSSRST
ncbi:Pr6Pr family membrane protein [Leptolyngbya iicbica]|uniref:Integral membrane protein n=2 Tax=Cyanophyceae TaxID=3028117 RepID=A0A4V2E3M2_9CYAN|nr:Pr6Pr family membrane protein [Leptolyngbya sp. LK]RZM82930.1 hypothetical protein DYY88_06960 [Leptolyngbya sp. LK]